MITIRYALMRSMDVNNGPGICASLYVQGCKRQCKECFNPETWDYNGGYIWNKRTEFQFIEACKNEHVKNICILGGEPLDQGKDLFNLLITLKLKVNKPIWLWTGYVWEDITNSKNSEQLLKEGILIMCDVVVDGPFIKELANTSLKYRGSSNQRVIDVKKTLEQNTVILYEGAY